MALSTRLSLLVAIMLGHLTEETYTGFRQQFPLGEMSRSLFVTINVLLYGYCTFTFLLLKRDRARGRPLARLLALAMVGNGAGHPGAARVLDTRETPPELLQAIFRGMANNEQMMADSCLIEVTPQKEFITYGVGIPLMQMRDPKKARGRAPVDGETIEEV